jgi:hypothetical protein
MHDQTLRSILPRKNQKRLHAYVVTMGSELNKPFNGNPIATMGSPALAPRPLYCVRLNFIGNSPPSADWNTTTTASSCLSTIFTSAGSKGATGMCFPRSGLGRNHQLPRCRRRSTILCPPHASSGGGALSASNGTWRSIRHEALTPILLFFALYRWSRRVLALQPVGRSAGTVARAEPLRHDAFDAHLAGVCEH